MLLGMDKILEVEVTVEAVELGAIVKVAAADCAVCTLEALKVLEALAKRVGELGETLVETAGRTITPLPLVDAAGEPVVVVVSVELTAEK